MALQVDCGGEGMNRETISIDFSRDPLWGERWLAVRESYSGADDPIGVGATPAEALEALLEMEGAET